MEKKDFDFGILASNSKAAENVLKWILEDSFLSVMITTAERGYPIVYVNPAFSELTKYEAEEVIGKTPSILQGPGTDDSVLGRLRDELSQGKVFHGKTRNYTKMGKEFMMEWKVFPIFNGGNEISYYLAFQREA